MSTLGIPIIDAHAHYFNVNTMKNWLRRGRTMKSFSNRTRTRTDMTSIELPDENWDTAQKWVDELDRYGIKTMGVMVGTEAYDEFKETMKRFPNRFIGYSNINPADSDASKKVETAARDGFKGIKLYPSSWKDLKVYDELCYPVYDACKSNNMLVFLHFGITIGGQADLRNGNPIDIQVPSRDYPELKLKSVALTERRLKGFDAVIITTAHTDYDYDWIVKNSHLVIDTRNAVKKKRKNVVKA